MGGVDWQNGLPEGPLLRIFELLHAEGTDSAKAAVSAKCMAPCIRAGLGLPCQIPPRL